MPIKPENKARYPKDWKAIRERILEHGGYACEQCGALNHAIGYRRPDGIFMMTSFNEKLAMIWPSRHSLVPKPEWAKEIEIVLTIAHLDHTPENCAPENLRALCQKCHLAYDHEHHQRNSYQTRRKGKAAKELF